MTDDHDKRGIGRAARVIPTLPKVSCGIPLCAAHLACAKGRNLPPAHGESVSTPCRVTVQPVRFQKLASVVVSVTFGVVAERVAGACVQRVMPPTFDPNPIEELT